MKKVIHLIPVLALLAFTACDVESTPTATPSTSAHTHSYTSEITAAMAPK